MHDKYREAVAFFIVYIEEAHASDGWQLDSNEEDGVVFLQPKAFDQRAEIASSCVADLGIQFPALVDDLDNSTERKYTAWPDRIYLIGADGKVLYKSNPGPFGFKPDELATELEKL